MSLERRIADALHAADAYQPSADLFARLHRSIEEDRAHRRRIRITVGLVALALLVLAAFLTAVAQRGPDGALTVPKWSVQLTVALVLTTILVTLGPALRRLGSPLLEDVFHLNPLTGYRFSRLLDIAYYLFFGGMIVSGFDPVDLTGSIGVPSDEIWLALAQVAGFVLRLGVVHTVNLALLPVIGLIFTSLARRAARRSAGPRAPAESPTARRSDRLAGAVVMTVAGLAIAGTLALLALILVSIGLS